MSLLAVAEAETGRGGGERFPQDLTAAFGGRCPALWDNWLPGWEPINVICEQEIDGPGLVSRVLKGTLGMQMWPPHTSAL